MLDKFESIVRRIVDDLNQKPQYKNSRWTIVVMYDTKNARQLSIYNEEKFHHVINFIAGCYCNENPLSAKMCVATLIGPGEGGSDYNRRFIPYLRRPSNKVELAKIDNHYNGCIVRRGVRLNEINTNLWFYIEHFNSLADLLKIFDNIPITRSKVSKQQCISELTALNAQNAGEWSKLRKNKHQYYHWLEFPNFFEWFDGESLLKDDTANVYQILEKAILKHVEGIELINKICPVI